MPGGREGKQFLEGAAVVGVVATATMSVGCLSRDRALGPTDPPPHVLWLKENAKPLQGVLGILLTPQDPPVVREARAEMRFHQTSVGRFAALAQVLGGDVSAEAVEDRVEGVIDAQDRGGTEEAPA